MRLQVVALAFPAIMYSRHRRNSRVSTHQQWSWSRSRNDFPATSALSLLETQQRRADACRRGETPVWLSGRGRCMISHGGLELGLLLSKRSVLWTANECAGAGAGACASKVAVDRS
jgi:hypothetical protein